jgi:hypothetical protein
MILFAILQTGIEAVNPRYLCPNGGSSPWPFGIAQETPSGKISTGPDQGGEAGIGAVSIDFLVRVPELIISEAVTTLYLSLCTRRTEVD